MQDSGTLEDADAAQPEDVKSGETRKSIRRRRQGTEGSGKPGDSTKVTLKDRRAGETRNEIAGNAEGRKIRGNPEIRQSARRRGEDSGKPGNSPSTQSDDAGFREA